tara:strand:- start:3051 stop:7739 length:4689 start_codon:yes stop_codon:yes gene_type:complete
MSHIFGTDVDFNKSNLSNVKLTGELSLPTVTISDAGLVMFNSGQSSFYGWNGSSWINFDGTHDIIPTVDSLNSLSGALNIVSGSGDLNVTTNGSNKITITSTANVSRFLKDVFVTNGVAQLGVVLTVPEGTTSLTNDFAFNAKIIEVNFASTLTATSSNSFAVNLLTNVDINNITSIGIGSFNANRYLNTLNLRSVQIIGSSAFQTTGDLGVGYDLVFPSTVYSLGTEAFSSSKINSVTFDPGNQITNIQARTFQNTNGFTAITLPSNLTTIGGYAFNNTNLTSIVIPNSVTSIGVYAFKGNPLTSVIVNNGTIGDYAFWGITNLTSLTLGSGVTSIGVESFRNTRITTLTIPSTVTSMGTASFAENLSLTSAIINSTVIGTFAFKSSPLLSTVTLSNNLLSIGNDAFMLTALTSVVIPNTVVSLGISSFQDTSLSSIVFNSVSSIIDIPQGCFQDSWGNNRTVTTLTLPASLQTFGTSSFQQAGIETLAIPNTVTTIGSNAFYGQKLDSTSAGTDPLLDWTSATRRGLNILTFDAIPFVTTIGDSAFKFNALTSVTIPASVTSIGASAFEYNDISSIILPATVTTVGTNSFSNNPNLTNVTINSTQANAGQAFNNIATTITTVNIGSGVTANGGIFTGSTGIETLDIAANAVTNINSFDNLTIGTLTVDGTSTINSYSFTNSTITLGTIGSGITLPTSSFYGADFTTLNIGDTVIIGNSSFYGSIINSLNIGNNATTFANSFDDVNIGTMTIGTGAVIATGTFDSQSVITGDLTIGINSSIGSSAAPQIFIGGTLDIGATLNTIGSGAFSSATISNGLTIVDNLTLDSSVFSYSTIGGNLSTIGNNVTLGASSFYGVYFTTLNIGNTVTIGDSAFYGSTISTLNIGNNFITGANSFDDVTIANMTIGADAQLASSTFDTQSFITNLTIGDNLITISSVGVSMNIVNNLTIGNGANLSASAFNNIKVGNNLTLLNNVTLDQLSFGTATILNLVIGDNAIIGGSNISSTSGAFSSANITGNISIGINADVQGYAFSDTSLATTITNLTIGSGSSLKIGSFRYHDYLSFSLGINLTFEDYVFQYSTLTGNFTIDPTWILAVNSFSQMNVIGNFIVPNNKVLPELTFPSGTISGDLILGTGVTLPNRCFYSTDITGNLTIPISTILTGIEHFEGSSIGTVNIPNNFILVSQMFSTVIIDTITLGNNVTIPSTLFISGTVANMIVGDNSIGTFSQQTAQVTNMTFGSNNTLDSSSSASYINLTIGLNNDFASNAFNGCEVTNLTMPAPVTAADVHTFTGTGFFTNNNISSIPAYFSSSLVNAFPPNLFTSNVFSGNITFPSNITIFDDYCFSSNDITGITNLSPVYNIYMGDGVFQGNNFSAIPDFLEGILSGELPNYLFAINSFTSLTIDATNSPWITKLGVGCFQSNYLLTTVVLDAGNTNHVSNFLTTYAFQGCNISSFTFLETGTGSWNTNTVSSSSVFKGNNFSTLPTGLFGTGSVVGETTIDYEMFMDNSFSGSLTIPNGVTSISSRAFKNNALTSVSVPAGINIVSDSFDPGVTITYRP